MSRVMIGWPQHDPQTNSLNGVAPLSELVVIINPDEDRTIVAGCTSDVLLPEPAPRVAAGPRDGLLYRPDEAGSASAAVRRGVMVCGPSAALGSVFFSFVGALGHTPASLPFSVTHGGSAAVDIVAAACLVGVTGGIVGGLTGLLWHALPGVTRLVAANLESAASG